MTPSRPLEILHALIQGLDPLTGEPLASDSALHRAEVLRALLAAVAALEQSAARAQRRAQLPDNVGYRAGESPAALAEKHRRTRRAIEVRLERMGLLRAEQRVTRGGFSGVSEAAPPRRAAHGRPARAPLTRRGRRIRH
jgi:hypothetical protein